MQDYLKQKPEDTEVNVKVKYPNTNEKVEFKFSWTSTLRELLAKAYAELEEAVKPEDILLNKDGAALTQYMDFSLREAHDKHLCPGFSFLIKSETGGATPDYGVPVPNNPSVAAQAIEVHLKEYLSFNNTSSIEDLGILKPDSLTLLIPILATGNGLSDEYLLKLHFGYYPDWPPSARFVNPETLTYDKQMDARHLPLIEGSNELAVHRDFGDVGQLICNSTTLEFYLCNHSYNKKEHLWRKGMTFETTIANISYALKSNYYKGRQQ